MSSVPPPPPGPPPACPGQTSRLRSVTDQVSPTLAGILKGLFGNGPSHGHNKGCRDPELHQAAFRGDETKIKDLLEKHEGRQLLNFRNHLGCTPLRLAVAGGRVSCVKVLLRYGASIDIPDIKAQSPVMVATKNNNIDILRILLDSGADPNGDKRSMYTPLFWAAQEGNCQSVKELLKYGAFTDNDRFLNASPSMAQNPAGIAMAYGHLNCFRELLLAGAEQNVRQVVMGVRCSLYHVAVVKDKQPDFVTMLYEHGVPFVDQVTVQTMVAVDNRLERHESWQVAKALFSQPRSLVAICRITIRKYLLVKRRLSEIKRLPLPTRILQYLEYTT